MRDWLYVLTSSSIVLTCTAAVLQRFRRSMGRPRHVQHLHCNFAFQLLTESHLLSQVGLIAARRTGRLRGSSKVKNMD